jgi:YaiO family outer membrane protein
MKRVFFLGIVMLLVQVTLAQVDTSSLNADELFTIARDKAFNGEREEARKLCRMALEKNPNYLEIAVFMGRTYSWDGKRDEARKVFKGVLEKEPAHIDATLAIADVEIWDDKPQDAIVYLDKALAVYPNNFDLLFKKAKALVDAKKDEEALIVLSRAIELKPGNKDCIELRESIRGRKLKNTLAVSLAGDYYTDSDPKIDPMYYSYVQFGTITKLGSLIGRVNYAHRFGSDGIQPEVDFYPRLWKGAYGYFNYGFTISDLFPRHRIGGEVYQSLPKSFEASLGFRNLRFDSSEVMIYTASVGWYYKNYWFNARTYLTPDKDLGAISKSLNLTTRRYFSDANNYISFAVGGGFSPDTRRIQTNVGLDSGNNIYFLKSQKVTIGFQKSIRYNLLLNGEVYYSNQELSGYRQGQYVQVVGFTAGLKIRL